MTVLEPNAARPLAQTAAPHERTLRRAAVRGRSGRVGLAAALGTVAGAMARRLLRIERREDVRATLSIGGHVLRFRSLRDFEFALASRTGPPVSRLIELDRLTLFELRSTAGEIRTLETRLSEILAASMERGRSLGALLPQVDIRHLSTDHDWRAIFAALAAQRGPRLDGYRRVALAKYMQYLRERQAVIQHLYATRDTEALHAQLDAAALPPRGPLQDTSLFDFIELQASGVDTDGLRLLPRGESVALSLAGAAEVDIVLARLGFKLRPGQQTCLVDPDGNVFALRPGRNIVGRSQACDVAVNPDFRGISRKHLVIDRIDAQTVVLTDLSSHGTRVPGARVVGTLAPLQRPAPPGGTVTEATRSF